MMTIRTDIEPVKSILARLKQVETVIGPRVMFWPDISSQIGELQQQVARLEKEVSAIIGSQREPMEALRAYFHRELDGFSSHVDGVIVRQDHLAARVKGLEGKTAKHGVAISDLRSGQARVKEQFARTRQNVNNIAKAVFPRLNALSERIEAHTHPLDTGTLHRTKTRAPYPAEEHFTAEQVLQEVNEEVTAFVDSLPADAGGESDYDERRDRLATSLLALTIDGKPISGAVAADLASQIIDRQIEFCECPAPLREVAVVTEDDARKAWSAVLGNLSYEGTRAALQAFADRLNGGAK